MSATFCRPYRPSANLLAPNVFVLINSKRNPSAHACAPMCARLRRTCLQMLNRKESCRERFRQEWKGIIPRILATCRCANTCTPCEPTVSHLPMYGHTHSITLAPASRKARWTALTLAAALMLHSSNARVCKMPCLKEAYADKRAMLRSSV